MGYSANVNFMVQKELIGNDPVSLLWECYLIFPFAVLAQDQGQVSEGEGRQCH